MTDAPAKCNGFAMNSKQFEQRKQQHLDIALGASMQASELSQMQSVRLIHEALPDLDFQDVQTSIQLLNLQCSSPIFISSMTAGHQGGEQLNQRLACFAQDRGLLMGVGSQRKELSNPAASAEWKALRSVAPKANLIGNVGVSQLLESNPEQIQRLVEQLEAKALFVHLNPLQECLQPEGTPFFRGALKALELLVAKLSVPVIVKEVGCGLSSPTMQRLSAIGVQYLDVSGAGGTHWGRIEGARSESQDIRAQAAQTFAQWGISTGQSLLEAKEVFRGRHVWASGGVRSGLDVAKLLAMGAEAVGMAQPFLLAALESEQKLHNLMDRFEFELRVAMFCTGVGTVDDFKIKKVWSWI